MESADKVWAKQCRSGLMVDNSQIPGLLISPLLTYQGRLGLLFGFHLRAVTTHAPPQASPGHFSVGALK